MLHILARSDLLCRGSSQSRSLTSHLKKFFGLNHLKTAPIHVYYKASKLKAMADSDLLLCQKDSYLKALDTVVSRWGMSIMLLLFFLRLY